MQSKATEYGRLAVTRDHAHPVTRVNPIVSQNRVAPSLPGCTVTICVLFADSSLLHSEQRRSLCPRPCETDYRGGDYVIVVMLAKRERDETGPPIVAIFRLSADRLVEHWEVRQAVVQSELRSNNMTLIEDMAMGSPTRQRLFPVDNQTASA